MLSLPRCGAERDPETGDAPLSSSAERLVHELRLRRWIDPPKRPFPRLFLGTRYFDKVPVQ